MGQKWEEQEHHPAVDSLVTLFIKAHHDLSLLHFKLDKEFQQIYPDNANPMKLVGRIKKIQDELSSLKDQCRQLLTAKQLMDFITQARSIVSWPELIHCYKDLIDKATSILVGNRSMVQRMQASVGIPVTDDSEDAAFSSFNQIIDEWTTHVRSKTGNGGNTSMPEDINDLLFASIVGSN